MELPEHAESGKPGRRREVTLQIHALVLDDGRVAGSVARPNGAEEAFDGWLELLGQLTRALGPPPPL